ncbi:fimbrial protein [Achromobacter marplatensis]|uniref:fimbrial protein n=1 Tax=Achromobacter marplatensis TaxID=470868 RepID=UPI0028E20230|nr:fimbrial protein [Achromobacter marplatensis]
MTDASASPRRQHPGLAGVLLPMCLAVTLVLAPASRSLAQSDSSKKQIRIDISGTIRAKVPCIINDNQPISIPFGDVQITRIDGQYKMTVIPYTLDCKRAGSYALKMKISGDSADFNTNLLSIPTQSSLGIALKRGTTNIALNDWFSLNPASPPTLQAVLVAHGTGEITGGEFSASATMVVDYQ